MTNPESKPALSADVPALPELPHCGVGALSSGEEAILRAWAQDYALAYGAACRAAGDVPREQFDALLKQEHDLSAAYVRLRQIIDAMDPPAGCAAPALWAYVESVARERMAPAGDVQPVAPEQHAAMSRLIELAAECAQRKPLQAFVHLTDATHIGHRQFAAAHSEADDAVRILAIELRKVWDSLRTPTAAPAAQPAPAPVPAFDQRLQHFEWVLHQYRDGNCDRDAVDESRSAVFRATPAAPSVPPLPDDTIAAALADPACTRLREWAAIGPVQRAAVQSFADRLAGPSVPADEKPSRADLLAAVQFYADREHVIWTEESAWDTVSGEPQNWWCDEAGTAMIEDGTLAKMTLEGRMTAQHFAALKEGEDIDAAAPHPAQAPAEARTPTDGGATNG